jgi:uncharacterized protein involved in exopolysaccharide biosynthesis
MSEQYGDNVISQGPGPDAHGAVSAAAPAGSGDDLSLVDLAIAMLVHRRLVIFLPLAFFAVVVGIGLLLPRTYTASGTFAPQRTMNGQSSLLNLAAQFGMAVPGTGGEESPAFYAELLSSRALLLQIAVQEYEVGMRGGIVRGDLATILEVDETVPDARRERVVERLGRLLAVRRNRETGSITLFVTTRWPDLSHQIATNLLQAINDFNLETRQHRATAERAFVSDRLDAMRGELHTAESALERFLNENRMLGTPRLHFEQERLASEVAFRRQMTTQLSQAFEQARIDEIRNTPAITVIDAPHRPHFPDRRGLLRKGALALLLGVVAAIVAAYFLDRARMARMAEIARIRELQKLRGEVIADLRRPWRLLIGS